MCVQNWIKKGLFFEPNKNLYWQNSHAAIPTSIKIDKNIVRTFFNSRDKNNKAYVGHFDWDLIKKDIVYKTDKPILSPGEYGLFDDHGTQVTSIVKNGKEFFMYYLGWNPGVKKPLFYTSIGLAISTDGAKTFKKFSKAPIMQRSAFDPWMVSGGTVIKEKKNWRMYYLSGQKISFNGELANSYYDIKYAESKDGISWKRDGTICLSLKKNETNISRMSIIKEKIYRAWYPYKKKGDDYRIGYAESKDGIIWHRKDNLVNLNISKKGWDSKALDKVEIIEGQGEIIMLYNGNRFGYDGIGLAVLSK